MHRFAGVAECSLSESFRITATIGTLSPRISEAVKGDAFDVENPAAAPEFRRSLLAADPDEAWEKRSRFGKRAENSGQLRSDSQHAWFTFIAQFPSLVDQRHRLPINILRFKLGGVQLRRSDLPKNFVVFSTLVVALGFDDGLKLRKSSAVASRIG